jgi:hypothetical protein
MLAQPFQILECSWPRPASLEGSLWCSEPEWDTPVMPFRPRCHLELLQRCWCWVINWSNFLHFDLRRDVTGKTIERDLPDFYCIWRIQMQQSGILLFQGEGCYIRRNTQVCYACPATTPAVKGSLAVQKGDMLEIAQLHSTGYWQWWASLHSEDLTTLSADPVSILDPYLQSVQEHLCAPNGPALKLFSEGQDALRLVIGVYSLILNGSYRPSKILLFGEHQWDQATRALFYRLLPFVQFVPTSLVLSSIERLGSTLLLSRVQAYPEAMKVAANLLYSPQQFCYMDDETLILGRLDDALSAFKTHHYVYSQLPTERRNAGLYWLHETRDPQAVAHACTLIPTSMWERGFVKALFAHTSRFQLSNQRYLCPVTDGIPGGLLGYDYRHNPCGFACLHLCHLAPQDKLSNGQVLSLLTDLLAVRDYDQT